LKIRINSTLTREFVTDTRGLVLPIERGKLGPNVKPLFEMVKPGNATIYAPALVFAEMLYLF